MTDIWRQIFGALNAATGAGEDARATAGETPALQIS
jgi:hypothetical protein